MSKTPEEADLESIFSDWSAVGKDLASAIEDYEKTETSSEEIEQDSFKS